MAAWNHFRADWAMITLFDCFRLILIDIDWYRSNNLSQFEHDGSDHLRNTEFNNSATAMISEGGHLKWVATGGYPIGPLFPAHSYLSRGTTQFQRGCSVQWSTQSTCHQLFAVYRPQTFFSFFSLQPWTMRYFLKKHMRSSKTSKTKRERWHLSRSDLYILYCHLSKDRRPEVHTSFFSLGESGRSKTLRRWNLQLNHRGWPTMPESSGKLLNNLNTCKIL